MEKLVTAAALSLFAAGAASATEYTLSFETPNGVETIKLDDQTNMLTRNGEAVAYTFNEDTLTLCRQLQEDEHCIAFAQMLEKTGESTAFTSTDGSAGIATLISKEG